MAWFYRSFLLLLLVGDWAWDTHFGNDIFSQPMSSYPALHAPFASVRAVSVTSTVPHRFVAMSWSDSDLQGNDTPEQPGTAHFSPSAELIYVLMSIQR
jgi:hypothetical protein